MLVKRILATEGMTVSSAFDLVNIGKDIGEIVGAGAIGVPVSDSKDLAQVLKDSRTDVLLDFTIAKATAVNAPVAADAGVNLIIGTTGLSDEVKKSIADAVAARAIWGAPAIIVDLGTTTNVEVIDQTGAFAGGIIAPGVALGARSLAAAAARLPMIELRAPASVIGRNTRAAMQSGVVLGEVARVDGLLDAIAGELGVSPKVVITGDGAEAMSGLLRHETTVDATLTLRGLWGIWRLNARG